MPDDPLTTYLNDHLAGAAAGRELAEKIARASQGTPLGEFMSGLFTQIDEDRTTLKNLVAHLGVERQSIKEVAGSVAEKLTRLRLTKAVTGSAELSQFLEMEVLSTGIHGKLCLWQALHTLAQTDSRLAVLDTTTLINRAIDQLTQLESHRLDAAQRALGAAAAPS